MSYYPSSVLNLIKNFSRLPGIGGKTAERFALHILRVPRKEAEELSRSILELKEKVRFCSVCFSLCSALFAGALLRMPETRMLCMPG